MVVFPISKINLGLFVTEKRDDGFHNIETVFYPLNLCDALEVVTAEKTVFSVSGIEIPSKEEDNLCMKAYNLINDAYNVGAVDIHLLKKIPIGSGLGGGSSDAVYTLKALNSLFDLNIPDNIFYDMARKLGSDCAFFLQNTPKFANEKGDVFEEVDSVLKGYHIVVVVPPVSVDTTTAYSKISPHKNRESVKNIIKLPIEDWKYELYNDFEFSIFENFPQIQAVKEKLYKMGAVYASMSGSGSAVYGLFNEKICVDKKFKDCFVWQEQCLI